MGAAVKWADWGTNGTVPDDEIDWSELDGNRVTVNRLRFIGDRIPGRGVAILDLSYMYVTIGDRYCRVRNVPFDQYVGPPNRIKAWLYNELKKVDAPFLEHIFTNLSVDVD